MSDYCLWLGLAIVPPMLLASCFHLTNQAYPCCDEADYFFWAQRIYEYWREHGSWSTIQYAYLERIPKGIFQPLLGVPALVLTGGQVLASLGLTMLALFGAFLVYVFSLFSLYLPLQRSALATLVVGFTTGIIENTFNFNTELPLMLCAFGALFHLERMFRLVFLRIDSFAFVFWLTLGLCIRPVEVVLLFGLPLGLLMMTDDTGVRRALARSLMICVLGAVIWFAPVTTAIFDWVIISTYSEYAVQTGSRAGVSYLRFLWRVAAEVCGFPLLVLGVSAVVAGRFRTRWKLLVAVLFAMVHPLVGGFTPNGDPRYYAVTGVLFYMVALVFALSATGLAARVRLVLVWIVLLLVAVTSWRSAGGVREPLAFSAVLAKDLDFLGRTRWRANPEPPFVLQDPNVRLLENLIRIFPERVDLSIGIVYHGNRDKDLSWLDPRVLEMAAIERRKRVRVTFAVSSKMRNKTDFERFPPDVIVEVLADRRFLFGLRDLRRYVAEAPLLYDVLYDREYFHNGNLIPIAVYSVNR